MRRVGEPRRYWFILCLGVVLAGWLVPGCSGDEEKKGTPSPWPDASTRDKGSGDDISGPVLDGRANDLGVAKDFEIDEDGPKIEILSPKETDVIVGALLKVEAKISDPDGIDNPTVNVEPQGLAAIPMSISATTPQVYEGLIDISSFGENVRIYVHAADLQGNKSTVQLEFKRDPGPVVQINSPATDSRHKGSLSFQALVAHQYKLTLFEARIGSVKLELTEKKLDDHTKMFNGTVKFDEGFTPPLSGKQVLTVVAENENKARVTLERIFHVDDQGPAITITSHAPGELIGGIIEVSATVEDLAGVVASSVRCVIGNNLDTREVLLSSSGGSTFTGQFNTRTLSQFDLWPVMSFRASDSLGNENHVDIQVGLDNGPPRLDLDPPDEDAYFHGREKDGILQCSHPFDPVGEDAADDMELVPQVMMFRLRAQDLSNHVPSAPWAPIATINPSSVRMFFLDDTSKPLVIDTNEDGWCDAINPAVVPLGTTPTPEQAVAVDLVAVPPTGSANFTPYTFSGVTEEGEPIPTGKSFPFFDCNDGDDEKPPETICDTVPMTIVTFYLPSRAPNIYAIPPLAGLGCVGLPFDFGANSFEDGWTCVAAEASDNLGNHNVSPPIHVWVKKDAVSRGPLPTNAGEKPKCTGTLQADGSIDANKPCKFRATTEIFPQSFHDPFLRVEK